MGCDAMDELKTCFEGRGADIVGSWSTDGYDHMESKSIADGKFVGLPCDEDNQLDQSEERVKAWIAQIKGEGMPLQMCSLRHGFEGAGSPLPTSKKRVLQLNISREGHIRHLCSWHRACDTRIKGP